MQFIPRSLIYQDTGITAFLPGLKCFAHWGGPVASTTKNRNCRGFYLKTLFSKQNPGQSHLTLGYFLLQYHFAPHPPFKVSEFVY
jgi:hypothetical protein